MKLAFRGWLASLASMSGLVLSLMLIAAPAPAHAQNGGWRECAREGQSCDVGGRGMVRYGVDGQWSTRVLSGRINCDNQLFGDPAPQLPKRCEVRDYGAGAGAGAGGQGWVFCAAEGETCYMRGSGDVRFGADRQYTVRRAMGSVRCDVESFGDPLQGQTKHCEVRVGNLGGGSDPWGGSDQANDSNRWRQCATEGQTCFVRGRSEVRFGDGRRFARRTVNGNVLCSTSVFGDPAVNVVKHCEVRAGNFGGWGDGGPADGGWQLCAEENSRCDVGPGRAQVRFGLPGRYVYRDVYGAVNCDNANFGSDPAPSQRKRCEMRR